MTHEHVWDGGKVTKKATTTTEGVKTYTCTIKACGQTKTEKIPNLKPTVPTEKITIAKKPSIKKPAATKSKITVKWKHFKHTSKKAKKVWKNIQKVNITKKNNEINLLFADINKDTIDEWRDSYDNTKQYRNKPECISL